MKFYSLPRFLLLPAACLALASTAAGDPPNPPAWWLEGDSPVITGGVENNRGPANIGQAKWMAKRALGALVPIDQPLADTIRQKLTEPQINPTNPEGPPLPPILNFDIPDPLPGDWPQSQRAPLLVGQLKAIAAPFYDAFHNAASTWLDRADANDALKGQLQLNGTKDPDPNHTDHYYPWTAVGSDDQNKAIATIGQLKAVFSLRFETLPPKFTDLDWDGMDDDWELANGLDPTDSSDSYYDPDVDGIDNLHEYVLDFNPQSPSTNGILDAARDSDGDGMPDWWEVSFGELFWDELLQRFVFVRNLDWEIDDANEDPDGESLSNFAEFLAGTNPLNYDTDGDHLPDDWEVARELDPTNPADAGQPFGNGGWGVTNLEAWQAGVSSSPTATPVDRDGDGVPDATDTDPDDPNVFLPWISAVSAMVMGDGLSHDENGDWHNLTSIAWDGSVDYDELVQGLLQPQTLTEGLAELDMSQTPPAEQGGFWQLLDLPNARNLSADSCFWYDIIDSSLCSGYLTKTRLWFHAPSANNPRKFHFLKTRTLLTNDAVTGVEAGPLTVTVPANQTVSAPVDLETAVHSAGNDNVYYSKVRLVQVELRDVKDAGDSDDQVIDSMGPVPARDEGESEQDFWHRRNDYFQQQLPDSNIAFIEPHRAANNSPDMPRLVARLPAGAHGLRVRWRLEVEYLRGNGYRANYVEDFTRPEDKVFIPARQGENPAFTAEMEATDAWRIYEMQDWLDEIQQRGFFGGTGKLYVWPAGQQAAPTEPVITFRIGGKNPDQQLARTYIDTRAGQTFWYAYAIARHETFGRVRINGQIRFYNQFYTEYQGGPIGDASVDMGWATWAKGWPLYNLDRGRQRDGTRYQNGPGGYGMYQLTWGPKHPNDTQGSGSEAFIPRGKIWNWQDNVNGAITELQNKLSEAQALYSGLLAAYPEWPAIPNEGHLSGLEAIVVTYYNGQGGLLLSSRKINGRRRLTCWIDRASPQSGAIVHSWQFRQNKQRYVESVNLRINNTTP